MGILFIFFSLLSLSVNLYAEVRTLQEQAMRAYFSSRPLSTIQEDLKQNKLNRELQRALALLIINNYSKQLTNHFCTILKGHTNWLNYVLSVAFSHDSNYILTGSEDRTARLWDRKTGQTIAILAGHIGSVRAVIFSECGNYSLTGSNDKTARLWDLATGQTIRVLEGHTDWVTAVAISTCSKYALTGSEDKTARLWDLETGTTIAILQGHTHAVNSIAFSPDGKYVLTGSEDNTARLWDLTTAETIVTFYHTDEVISVAMSSDSTQALTGSLDKKIGILHLTTHTMRVVDSSDTSASPVAFNKDGTQALIVRSLFTLDSIDLATGTILHISNPTWLSIVSTAISPNGKYIVLGLTNGKAYLLDLNYYTMELQELLALVTQFTSQSLCTII